MNKSTLKNRIVEHESATATANEAACCETSKAPAAAAAPQKTKLEKTQSLLSVISTSIGLVGVAGSIFACGLSTFYTGTLEVHTQSESTPVVVKVYTREGHESVFHTKHIELMPGVYHLEIASTDGRVLHADTKISFHKTNTVPVFFGESAQSVNSASNSGPGKAAREITTTGNFFSDMVRPQPTAEAEPEPAVEESAHSKNSADKDTGTKKHHWWQIWKHSSADFAATEDEQK